MRDTAAHSGPFHTHYTQVKRLKREPNADFADTRVRNGLPSFT
jgi:hypothetical protein